MENAPSKTTSSVALLLIAVVAVQLGAALSKHLFPLIGPAATSALRLLFATVILNVAWRPWRMKLSPAQWRLIALYGVSLGAMNLMFYTAISKIPLGIAIALEFTGPLAVALGASRKLFDFVWALLAIAGILLLMPLAGHSQALDVTGVLFALGAGACWALYIIFGRKVTAAVHGGTAATLGMTLATLLVLPIGWMQAGGRMFAPEILPVAFGVALLGSVIPYSIEIIALKHLPMKTFGILMSLEPATGAIAGLLFLHERLSPMQWLAIACIICASMGSTLSVRKRAPLQEIMAE